MLNLDSIKPIKCGKYSPLLYKWLTHKHQKTWSMPIPSVFQSKKETLNGRDDWAKHWRPRDLILGRGEFMADGIPVGIGGRRLSDIICGQHGVMSQGYYYGADFGLRDITAKFWAEYERIGRCAWDHDHSMHMIGDENRYSYSVDGSRRTCNWCGRVFEVCRKNVIEQPRVQEVWSEYRTKVMATAGGAFGSLGEEAEQC